MAGGLVDRLMYWPRRYHAFLAGLTGKYGTMRAAGRVQYYAFPWLAPLAAAALFDWAFSPGEPGRTIIILVSGTISLTGTLYVIGVMLFHIARDFRRFYRNKARKAGRIRD